MKKESAPLFIGLLIGLLMPVFGVFLVMEFRPELIGIQKFDQSIVKSINTQIITLGMILNAGLFFLFLKFDKEKIGQGILSISVIYLIMIFVYRFLL